MADINLIYGENIQEMTAELLAEENVASRLDPGMTVVIKPNLVVGKPAAEGATTHPEIVEGIVHFLRDHGIRKPMIAEGSWLGETTARAFQRCGYTALAEKYALELVDTKKDKVLRKTAQGLTLTVCETLLKADFLINVPVLKGHCQTTITCCLKNLKGCIPDTEKRRYHNIGLHKPIAALNTILKPDLHVVDGICGDPTFEEGGNPVLSNRILAGRDPVLLDSYGAALLGCDPGEIDYLRHAVAYGVGKMFDENATVRELRTENRPKTSRIGQGDLIRRLAGHIDQRSACSACYAALIFALNKTGGRCRGDKIKIGQGFRGRKCDGFGVGNCTSGCERFVDGCPPSAIDIIKALDSPRNS